MGLRHPTKTSKQSHVAVFSYISVLVHIVLMALDR